jgi:hypothetical protein
MAHGNDRFLFLHVAKTGGTWAPAAMKAAGVELRSEGRRHAGLNEVEREGRFTFAFVREPLSWYASWWQHCRVVDPSHLFRAFFHAWPPDHFINLPFEQYVAGCANWSPGFVSELYRRWVGPPEAPIDFVGRYESLADDLVHALRAAGQDFDEEVLRSFRPLNVSAPMPECSQEVRELLMVAEREVYERFYR